MSLSGGQNNVLFYTTQNDNIISFYSKAGISLSSIDMRLIEDTGKLVNFNANGRWKIYLIIELF